MASDFHHVGETLNNIVCVPFEDYVIGVHVASRPEILPYLDGEDLPIAHKCRDRHILRTEELVAVVDVQARVRMFPRQYNLAEIQQVAREEAEEAGLTEEVAGSKADFDAALWHITERIIRRLGRLGVTVK